MKPTHTKIACLLACVWLAACASTAEPDPTAGWSAERLYAEAKDELDAGRYDSAVGYLQKLEARYPFGKLAQQAQIDTAFAHYRDGERGLALAAIDRFLKLHPNHEALDYVYYLKGLANFYQQSGMLQRIGGRDLSEQDLAAARESFDSFRTVVTRFPDSKYVSDSKQRMQYLVNAMAAGETSIARFYYQRGAYVAAANRAQEVVRQYQEVPAVEEALYILMRSYDKLGLDHLKDGAERVLQRNFPDSEIYERGLRAEGARWWQVWK